MFRILATTAALSLALTAAAQAGDIQEDIQACGEAAVAADLLPEDGYTLRYVSDKGKKNRVLTLKVIADRDDNETIECRMKRREIKEVAKV